MRDTNCVRNQLVVYDKIKQLDYLVDHNVDLAFWAITKEMDLLFGDRIIYSKKPVEGSELDLYYSNYKKKSINLILTDVRKYFVVGMDLIIQKTTPNGQFQYLSYYMFGNFNDFN